MRTNKQAAREFLEPAMIPRGVFAGMLAMVLTLSTSASDTVKTGDSPDAPRRTNAQNY